MNPKNSTLGTLARRSLYYVFSMNREFEREIQRPGISLQPYLNRDARQLAEQIGFGSLSNETRFLLTQELALAKAVFSSTIIDRRYNGPACPVAASP